LAEGAKDGLLVGRKDGLLLGAFEIKLPGPKQVRRTFALARPVAVTLM
jgi:hypothetical protein